MLDQRGGEAGSHAPQRERVGFPVAQAQRDGGLGPKDVEVLAGRLARRVVADVRAGDVLKKAGAGELAEAVVGALAARAGPQLLVEGVEGLHAAVGEQLEDRDVAGEQADLPSHVRARP